MIIRLLTFIAPAITSCREPRFRLTTKFRSVTLFRPLIASSATRVATSTSAMSSFAPDGGRSEIVAAGSST